MIRRETAECLLCGALGGAGFFALVALLGWLHLAPPLFCWGGA